uniref:Uncharacterized protein n=1 Tax=Knipowitschia caucasica TaxID=637954 RepID=A0AAV2L3A0_KNICA
MALLTEGVSHHTPPPGSLSHPDQRGSCRGVTGVDVPCHEATPPDKTEGNMWTSCCEYASHCDVFGAKGGMLRRRKRTAASAPVPVGPWSPPLAGHLSPVIQPPSVRFFGLDARLIWWHRRTELEKCSYQAHVETVISQWAFGCTSWG